MNFKKRLVTPGPTPVPEQIMSATARPMIHHRSPEFEELFRRVNENLCYLFQTKQNVITLCSSGTGAMEAAVANLLSPGDEVLYVNGGKFGERWGEICRSYRANAVELQVEWGESVAPEKIAEHLRARSDTKAVFVTHSETSTGAAIDIKEIARVVRENSNAVLVADGIASVGVMELRMDDWGIDVVVTGSQKGLMIPPGLTFIALSERAWRFVEDSSLPRYYFDLRRAREALIGNRTPWTPAVSLIVGLDLALRMIRDEGIERVWMRHEVLGCAIREGCRALGLKLVARCASNALTAVWIPHLVEAKRFFATLKSGMGITLAGGQGQLMGKIFRISHLGYFDLLDAISIVSAVETALRASGWTCEPGAGVRAAQTVLNEKSLL